MPDFQSELAVIQGEDKGKIWRLDPAESYDLGRQPDCAIALSDGRVSHRHARVESIGGLWFVSDLGSRNGTLVNGGPVQARKTLFHDDVIQLGRTLLQYREVPQA